MTKPIDPGPDGSPHVDRPQAADVLRWRKAERIRLLAIRAALPVDYRAAVTERIVHDLEQVIPWEESSIVSAYWPIRAEPDLRPWLRALHARGRRIALPVALAVGEPLEFREWQPGARLARGLWNIPYPADGLRVIPTAILAPVVGFDPECYRLGYGGGFFDRTLAALGGSPLVIGVGYPEGAIATIHPLPHDRPMSCILTGAEPVRRR